MENENVESTDTTETPLLGVKVGNSIDNTGSMPFFEPREETSISAMRKALHEVQAEEKALKESAENEETTETEIKEDENEKETTETEKDSEAKPEEQKEEPTEEPLLAKPVTFLVDGKEVAVSNNATVEIIVDGKPRTISLQEALNKASGDEAIQDRFKAVEAEKLKQKKEWEAKLKDADTIKGRLAEKDQVLSQIAKFVKEGNTNDLLGYLVMKSGGDPKETLKKLYSDSAVVAEKLQGMSPEAREAWYERYQLAVERAQLNEEKRHIEASNSYQAKIVEEQKLTAYTREALQDIGGTETEFLEQVNNLKENGIALQGKTSQDKINEVLDYIHESRVINIAKNIDPELLKNPKLLQKVFDGTLAVGIRKEEHIKKTFLELLGKEEKESDKRIAENLSRKVRKTGAINKAKEASAEKESDAPFSLTAFSHRRRGAY